MDGLASCSVTVFRLCYPEYVADENLEVWIQKKENGAEKKSLMKEIRRIFFEGRNINRHIYIG